MLYYAMTQLLTLISFYHHKITETTALEGYINNKCHKTLKYMISKVVCKNLQNHSNSRLTENNDNDNSIILNNSKTNFILNALS